ncbi:hypothetical protein DZK27_04200 [Rhodobacteraceae bacterium 63075]|nr:hypothetical protein DZK27_04200 [Rhodobacteraceae bacterium 63075]
MRSVSRPLKIVGALVLAGSLLFMLREVIDHREALAEWRPGWGMLAMLGALALAYGSALFLLAESWHRIIALYGAEPRHRTWPSYTTTLIARYLPGNVAHLLARAAWLRNGKVSTPDLARATAMELILPPLGAGLVLLGLLPFLPVAAIAGHLGTTPAGILSGAAIAALSAVAAMTGLLYRRLRDSWLHVLPPLLLSTLFMGALGTVFATMSSGIAGVGFSLGMVTGLVGWLVGYATPGAPGGLGSREAVITLMLSTAIPAEQAIVIALAFRLVTTLGELTCFAVGTLAIPRSATACSPSTS